ncbi:hypothetical protein [Amycolatopsis sp. NPDC050768]
MKPERAHRPRGRRRDQDARHVLLVPPVGLGGIAREEIGAAAEEK